MFLTLPSPPTRHGTFTVPRRLSKNDVFCNRIMMTVVTTTGQLSKRFHAPSTALADYIYTQRVTYHFPYGKCHGKCYGKYFEYHIDSDHILSALFTAFSLPYQMHPKWKIKGPSLVHSTSIFRAFCKNLQTFGELFSFSDDKAMQQSKWRMFPECVSPNVWKVFAECSENACGMYQRGSLHFI